MIGIKILKNQADIVLILKSLMLYIDFFLVYITIDNSFLQVLPSFIIWSRVKRVNQLLLISLSKNCCQLYISAVHPTLIHLKALEIDRNWKIETFFEVDLMRSVLAMLVLALLKTGQPAYI